MAEHHHHEEKKQKEESLFEKIADKIHGHDSGSDSNDDKPSAESSVKNKIWRLFGRDSDVHKCLGGGKRKKITVIIYFF